MRVDLRNDRIRRNLNKKDKQHEMYCSFFFILRHRKIFFLRYTVLPSITNSNFCILRREIYNEIVHCSFKRDPHVLLLLNRKSNSFFCMQKNQKTHNKDKFKTGECIFLFFALN